MIFRQNPVRLTPSQDARRAAGRQGLPPLWVHLGLALLPLASMVGCKGDGAQAVSNDPARTSGTETPQASPTPQGPWVLAPFAGDPVDPARDYLGGALGDRAAWRGLSGILIQNGILYLAEGDHTIRAAASHGGPWERAELKAFAGRRAMPSAWTGLPGAPGDGFLTAPGAMAPLGGDLIVAEPSRHCLKRVPLNGPAGWSLYAGRPGTPGRRGGNAADTRLGAPVALASDGITQVFAADAQHGLIWRFSTEGTGEAITAPGAFQDPQGLALGPDGRLYVADRGAHAIYRLTRAASGTWGAPERVAGVPGQPGFLDGGVGRLREPMGLAFDGGGRLLVADAGNHALRILSLDGPAPALGTLAGSMPGTPGAGQPGHRDGLAQEARFHRPACLALGQAGEIFVVEGPAGGASTLRVVRAGQVETLGRRDLGPVLELPGAREFGPMGALAAMGDGRLLAADAGSRELRVFRGSTLETSIPFPDGVEGPIHRLAATSDGAIRLLAREGQEAFISRDHRTWTPEGRGAVLDLAAHGMAPEGRVAELRARDGAYRVTIVHPRGEAHVDLRTRPQALALDAGNNLLVALPGEGGGIVLERHLAGPEGYRPDTLPAVRLALGERAGQGAILALASLDGDRVLLADASNALIWEATFSAGTFRSWAGAFPFLESKRAPRSSGDPLSALSGMALARSGDLYLATGRGLIRAYRGASRPASAPESTKPSHPRAPQRPQEDPAPASPLADSPKDADKPLAEVRPNSTPALAGEDPQVNQLRARLAALQAERNQHEAAAAQATARLQSLIAQHKQELNRLRERQGAEAEAAQAHLHARMSEAERVIQAVKQGSELERKREVAALAERIHFLDGQVWEMGGRLARALREGREAEKKAEAHLGDLQRALEQAKAEAEVLKTLVWGKDQAAATHIEALQAEIGALGVRLALAGEEASRADGVFRAEIQRLQALNAEREEAIQMLANRIGRLQKAAEQPRAEAQLQTLRSENAELREQLDRLGSRTSAASEDGAQLAALRAECGRLDLLRQALQDQVTAPRTPAAPEAPTLRGLAPGTRGVLYALDAQGRLLRHTSQGVETIPVLDGDQGLPLGKVATLDVRGTLLALGVDGRVFASSDEGRTWAPPHQPLAPVLDVAATPHARIQQAAFLLETGQAYTVAILREGLAESRVNGAGAPGPMALAADGTFALVVDPRASHPLVRIYRPDPSGHVLTREILLPAALPLPIGQGGLLQPCIKAMAFSPSGALVLVDAANRTLWRMTPEDRFVASVSPALLRQVFAASASASNPLPEPLDLGFTASGGLWILHGSGVGFLDPADTFQAPQPLGRFLRAARRAAPDRQTRPSIPPPQVEAPRQDAEPADAGIETRLPEGALEVAVSPWKAQVAAIHQDPQGRFRLSLGDPGGIQTLGLPRQPSALALMPDGRVMVAFQTPKGWAHVAAIRSTPSGLQWDPSMDLVFGPDLTALQAQERDSALAPAATIPAVTLTALAANAQGDLFLLDAPRGVLYRAAQGRTLQIVATDLQATGQEPLMPHFLHLDAQGNLLLARANKPFVLPLKADQPGKGRLDYIRSRSNGLLPRSKHRRAQLSREYRKLANARSRPSLSVQESKSAMIETSHTSPTLAESSARLTSVLPLGEGRLAILDEQGRLRLLDAQGQVTAFPVETGPGALRVASIARGRKGNLLIQSQNGRRFAWNPAVPASLADPGNDILGMAQAATTQGVNQALLLRMVDAPNPYQIAVNRQRGSVRLPGAVLKLEAQPLAWGLDGDGTLVVLRNLRGPSNPVPLRVLERYRTTDRRPTEYQICESPIPIQGATLRGPLSAHPVAVDLAVTPMGQILVADPANHIIWRLEPGTGTFSIWAGPERLEAARRQTLPNARSPLQGPYGLAALGDQGVYVSLADGVVWLPFPDAATSRPDTDSAPRPEGPESKRPAPPEEKHAAPVSESLDAPVSPTPAPLARASAERAGFRWEATLQPGDSDKGEFRVRVATTTPVGATEATIDLPDRPLAMALDPQGALVLLRATPTGDRLISVHTHVPNRPGIYRCQDVAWIERAVAGVAHFGPMTLAVDGQGDVAVACSAHRMVWRVEPATGKVTLLAGPNELDTAIQGTFQGPRALASHPDGGWILTHDQGTLTLPRRLEAPSESKRPTAAMAASPGTGDDGGTRSIRLERPEAKDQQDGVNSAPDPDRAEVLQDAAEAIAYAESILADMAASQPDSPVTPTRARQAASPSRGRVFRPAGGYKSLSPHLGHNPRR